MASKTRVDLLGAMNKIKNIEQVMKLEGPKILEQAGNIGVQEMRSVIDNSTTDWGSLRQSEGRESAGRRETDAMYNSVSSRVDGDVVSWGWVDGAAKYFLYQEEGTSKVASMHSLKDSTQKVLDELPRLIKNAKARIRYAAKKGK